MAERTAAGRSVAAGVLAAGLALGCGAASDGAPSVQASADPDPGNTGDTGASGGAGREGVAGSGGAGTPVDPRFEACPSAIGDAADLAATPRPDENLEFLALVVEPDQAVASQANYDRVVTDVAAIRELLPELATITFRPFHDGRDIRVHFDEAGLTALEENTFGAWDCLNEALGARVGGVVDLIPTYSPLVTLRGVHNMPYVERLYEQLPGIAEADIFEGRTPGPTWCIARDGTDYEYVIDWARGSCSSGCREHDAHHFSTTSAGDVTPLEVWRSAEEETPPQWYRRLCP